MAFSQDELKEQHNETRHCKTWRLFNWLRRSNDGRPRDDFARQAQAALDASETSSGTLETGRGSMYRAGVTLADLKPGQCGDVRRLSGSTQGRLRLLEMGLTPGTHVKVVRAAAFGGPIDVLVRGYQLSLRKEEASGVWLDDDESEAARAVADALMKANTRLQAGTKDHRK